MGWQLSDRVLGSRRGGRAKCYHGWDSWQSREAKSKF